MPDKTFRATIMQRFVTDLHTRCIAAIVRNAITRDWL